MKAFWGNRAAAVQKQRELGRADQGERAGVTGGQEHGRVHSSHPGRGSCERIDGRAHDDGAARAEPARIFPPTKLWDLLIILVAALELKSQVGPSFGNKFNNRTEEAIGTAVDLWTAFREGAFGEALRPFIGWLMLVEDATNRAVPCATPPRTSRSCRTSRAPPTSTHTISCAGSSAQERLYTTATVLASPRTAAETGDLYHPLGILPASRRSSPALPGTSRQRRHDERTAPSEWGVPLQARKRLLDVEPSHAGLQELVVTPRCRFRHEGVYLGLGGKLDLRRLPATATRVIAAKRPLDLFGKGGCGAPI